MKSKERKIKKGGKKKKEEIKNIMIEDLMKKKDFIKMKLIVLEI